MSTTTHHPKLKRRWYQFSLRTLLVVVTVATVAFGVLVEYRRYRARVNAVAAIEKLGGKVTSTYEERERRFDDPGGHDAPLSAVTFYLNITDADLKHLKGLPELKVLDLTNEALITDVGLEHLKGLTNLEHLSLRNTKVTDAGLEHLEGMTKLESLDLRFTKVTDKGVKKLQKALPNCTIQHFESLP